MLTKQCSSCKAMLPYSEFYPHKRMKLGLQPQCKKCAREWHRNRPEYVRNKNSEYKAKNPTYHTDWQRKKKYGINKEQADAIREKQMNKCAICGCLLSDSKECIDHCHKKGTVRGILCNSCNLALGYVKDSKETLLKMINYLIEAENY